MTTTLRTIIITLVMLLLSTAQGLAQWQITNGPTGFAFNRVTCFIKNRHKSFCRNFW